MTESLSSPAIRVSNGGRIPTVGADTAMRPPVFTRSPPANRRRGRCTEEDQHLSRRIHLNRGGAATRCRRRPTIRPRIAETSICTPTAAQRRRAWQCRSAPRCDVSFFFPPVYSVAVVDEVQACKTTSELGTTRSASVPPQARRHILSCENRIAIQKQFGRSRTRRGRGERADYPSPVIPSGCSACTDPRRCGDVTPTWRNNRPLVAVVVMTHSRLTVH
jgi:hypothetical protein